MQPPHLAQFAPLHKGRSFICYRDVNKAIERHRELYGLRLVLKKAIRLENYCLTVDQMRDLNFRLKYGELDYQCSVDNGRPGRPGNDERCPRLVRLRLSPDAKTLVVYDTHIHEPIFKKQSQIQGLSPPCPLQGPLLETQVKDGSSETSVTQTTPSTPVYQANPASEPSNVEAMLTPTTSPSYEKITMKIKKSHFSPNEMVVVGSARDTQEQLELRNTPEKTVNPAAAVPTKVGDQADTNTLARQLVEKLQANSSTTVVLKPFNKAPVQITTATRETTITPVTITAKPLQKIAPKLPDCTTIIKETEKIEKVPTKVNDSEVKSNKKTEKPMLVRNNPQILPKPDKPVEKVGFKAPQRILPKPVEKNVNKSIEKDVLKGHEKSGAKQSDKVVKTVEKNGNGNKSSSTKAPVRLSQRCLEKSAQRSISSNGTPRNENFQPAVSNSNGQKSNGKKMYKKKKTRQSDSSFDISSLVPLDAELGFNEKQQLAHGVLLRLLRVTSQLPMIEFTHAIDTLEMLTDAFNLEQRVNLTISQDEEEEAKLSAIEQDYYEEYYNFDNGVSPISSDHRITIAPVDGSGGLSNVTLPPETSSSHTAPKRLASFLDGFSDSESVNLQPKIKLQRISL